MVSVRLSESEQQELIKNDILGVITSTEKALKSLIVPGIPFKVSVPASSLLDEFVVGGSAQLAVDSRQKQNSGSMASIHLSQVKTVRRKKHKESCPHFSAAKSSSHSTLSGPLLDESVVGGSAHLAVDSRQLQGSGSMASIHPSQVRTARRKKHKENCPHFAAAKKSSHSTLSGPLSSMNSPATSVSSRKPRPAPLRTLQHVRLCEMADGGHRVHVSVTLPPGTDDDDQQLLLLDFKKDGSVAAVLNGRQLRKALK